MGVLRLATKPGQASAVTLLTRRPPVASACKNAQAVATMPTCARLPYVGQPPASVSPPVRFAVGAAKGPPSTLPMRAPAADGAAAEKARTQVLAPIGPQVPPAFRAVRTRGPRVIPTPSSVGASHVPATLAAKLESRAMLSKLPSKRATLLVSAPTGRLALQANATTRGKLLGPSASDELRPA